MRTVYATVMAAVALFTVMMAARRKARAQTIRERRQP